MPEAKQVRQPRIGVVTVTYGSESVLAEFLESLSQQTYCNFTLYVIDNASKDRTLEICRARTDLSIVIVAKERNLGVAVANNIGIRAALADGCEEVLLLNNDTVLSPELFAALHDGLVCFAAEMTTCKMYYHDAPNIIWCAGGGFRKWRGMDSIHNGPGQIDAGQFDVPRRVAYTPTCCLLVRASVFDRIGLMDERCFAYYDDADFLLRCWRQDISLWYIPEAKLWHKVSSLTSSTSDFTDTHFAKNRAYFRQKHLTPTLALLWYWIDQAQYAISVVLGRSSVTRWRLRRDAARQGLKMAHS